MTVFKRLVSAFITLFLATLALFIIIRLAPGDPIEIMYGRPGYIGIVDAQAQEARIAEMRAYLGLDQNIFMQYVQWLGRSISLDLGTSIRTGRPVSTELALRLPATLMLTFGALLIQLVFGVLFGVISAVRVGKVTDHAIRMFCVFFASIPSFVVGLALLLFFAVTHNIYSMGGGADLSRLWLPALTLGIVTAPQLIRIVRANILSELGQIYITSAISRGLQQGRIVKHAFKNALLPIITMVAISLAGLISGSVVIESIFSWPGIGNYAMNSILLRDYPVIQGYTVIMVFTVIMINLFVDLLYMLIDPRLRNQLKLGNQRLFGKRAG